MKVLVLKDGSEKTYELKDGDASAPLLERLESAGAKMPHGCRSGSCGSCLIWIQAGAECLKPVDAIEQDTLSRCAHGETKRLACRARVRESIEELRIEVPKPTEDSIY